MPAAVAVPIATAIIGAGGAVAGGVIASKASKHATDAQLQSNREAMDYTKQQQTERRQRYDAAYQDYRKQYDAWLKQYYGQEATVPNDKVHATSAGMPGAGGASQARSIADLMGGGSSPTPGELIPNMTGTQTGGPRSLADISGWGDWSRYGAA